MGTMGRSLVAVLLAACVMTVGVACERPPHVMTLEFVNGADTRLQVQVDGAPYPRPEQAWISPGETLEVVTGRSDWARSRRLHAVDERGRVLFDRSLTAQELDEMSWRVVLP